MINLFPLPATDQSIFFLGQIFGPVGTVLTTQSGEPSGTVLGAMFQTFNTIVLAVGALIIVYVTVVGVLKTAHEGEFLGKHWNNIWTPLRMVFGIAALVPTPSGYSTIQIIMMWIIVQGIGAADAVWNTVIRYQSYLGSPFPTVTTPSVGVGAKMETLFQAMACQESARSENVITRGPLEPNGGYYCARNLRNVSSAFCKAGDDSSGLWNITNSSPWVSSDAITNPTLVYSMGPEGACGTMTYCNPKNACNGITSTSPPDARIRCATCTAQQAALQQTVTAFGQIGKMFAQADYEYRRFYGSLGRDLPPWVQAYCSANGLSASQGGGEGNECCPNVGTVPGIPPEQTARCGISDSLSPGDMNNANDNVVQSIMWPYKLQPATAGNIDFVSAVNTNYLSSISAASRGIILQLAQEQGVEDQTLQEAMRVGWIYAGAFYWNLARGTGKNIAASMPELQVAGNNPSVPGSSNALSIYRNNYKASGKLLAVSGNVNTDSIASNLAPQLSDLSKLSDGLNSANQSMMNTFMHDIGGGSYSGEPQMVANPLANLYDFGKNLLIVAQLFFALVMYVLPPMTLIGYFDAYVLGTGFDNPIGGTITTLAIMFTPMFALFLGALFTFGALLSVYVPLIPYVIFTIGVVGWFILVIEAMIAAPLLAIGILSPGEGHEILGKAHHALAITFSIFLRPALMVFGMMAAMLLASVVVTMINIAFKGVMGSITTIGLGLVEMLLFMGAYVGLVLAALNKCFTLIHVIPDNIIRWLGGHAAGEGAAEALGMVKGGVAATGAAAAGYAGGMKDKAGESMAGHRKEIAPTHGAAPGMKDKRSGAPAPSVSATPPPEEGSKGGKKEGG